MVSSSDLWEQLVQLASNIDSVGLRQLGRRITYTRDTELVKDLGLTGDDAFQFMEDFASRFNVMTGDYRSEDYFEPEGLWLLSAFRKKKATTPVTLGMLLLAARDGIWDKNRLEQAYYRKEYD
ncbi:DUF1493 family protein [Paracidovorax citrulli]|uniref:DUF1493 family protein n=2 Tax=Paracidovorax citrulli TaxID=80869 RepID=A1TVY6_PARC0|nr:DUF1493 family protein [Paracidovorax citrulli]ABM35124.1 hypothetical protein Aave_4587 [Paracidovorax citrulli AAC00-1]ATG96357.1 DUF1493 domain-containing protein [Paracidovorax citrulli]MVT37615.1 DUF1493 family protein [Paracidovorax citrulli]PVY64575.1 uncharacterized protein DUF1493 [Paracidovorax citrulli]QCX10476.1 hypothetical protein APS58_1609 [Paracidovorax citrulli]